MLLASVADKKPGEVTNVMGDKMNMIAMEMDEGDQKVQTSNYRNKS